MGAEMLSILPVVMGAAQGYAGYSAKTAQGDMYEAEGIRLEGESRREASLIEDEGARFAEEQKMAYIGSGVEIGGSAVVTLAQTDKYTRTQADAVRARGTAIRDYYGRSGAIAKREGVAAFIQGIGGGIGTGLNTYYTAKAGFGGGGDYKKPATSGGGYGGKSGYGSGASAYKTLGAV
jgi:hypothetical protein